MSLFINVWKENGKYFVNIKTFITIYVFKVSFVASFKLNVRFLKDKPSNYLININFHDIKYEEILECFELAELCTWPIIVLENYVISGLCAVARQLCKSSSQEKVKHLLGFREACLGACAESSVWTKYCEIDVIQCVENLLFGEFTLEDSFLLPEVIIKYENHLQKPVRIHNIYKIARDNQNNKSLTSSTPRKDLDVQHIYAEGPYITLADVILNPCFQVFFEYCDDISIKQLPLAKLWYNRLKETNFPKIQFSIPKVNNFSRFKVITHSVHKVSLYNADPTRVATEKHTKQYKIDKAIAVAEKLKGDIVNNDLPFGFVQNFGWTDVPIEANPQGGALPEKRAGRKCEQLENLAKAVLEVVGNKIYKIVDFCSGSGHLGILVATLLPQCNIVLVENKEISLARARATISILKLTNIVIVQSNLDYFKGSFDLGMALHACGVATDLVIQMCIRNKADFVCCPCCYGGIKNCHEVSYPRSNNFKTAFSSVESYYFHLAHAADQTHEAQNAKTKQGYFCMDVIDTDRRIYAETLGYEVHLGKLQPITCTNKNNLLVGKFVKGK